MCYNYWFFLQDAVIFTTDVTRCPYYIAESENVKSRFACILPNGYINEELNGNNNPRNYIIPINQKECEVYLHGW